MQYVIYKLSLKIKRWSKRKMIIRQDFFYYYKHDNQKEMHYYHISELLSIEMAKEDEYQVLKLHFNFKDELTITLNEDTKKLKEIRNLLLITKRNYGIALIESYYRNMFLADYNSAELKSNIKTYTTNSVIKNIDDMLKKNKPLIDNKAMIVYNKTQHLIQKCTNKEEIDEDMNEPFNPYPPNIKDINNKNDYSITPNEIDAFFSYYISLIQILSTIRKNQIEYRFNMTSLLNKAKKKYNRIDSIVVLNIESTIINKNKENTIEEEIYFDTDNITQKDKEGNNNKDNIICGKSNSQQLLIEQLKQKNKELKDQYLTSLNKYAKKKEKLKRFIIASHLKIYYCYNCGNVLSQTESEQPTCTFDDNCTNNSLFYCRKCKVAFCTYCIIYQRNTKCANNHRLFPSKVPDLCLLCNDSDSKTYFSCQHCGVAVCSHCMGERQTKEISCYNCSTELVWRREVYAECNRCSQVKHCFWGCTNCDYSLCLNCVNTNSGFCGAAHRLNEYNTTDKWTSLKIQKEAKFSNNFHMKFMGKCMKCDIIIEGKCFACLRCAYFICNKCS